MTMIANRRRFLALSMLVPLIAAGAGARVTADAEDVMLSVTMDENVESVFGAADLIIDGEKQGLLSAGCCMLLTITPGPHEITLRWADTTVSQTFEAAAGKQVSFFLTAERELSRIDP